MNNNENLVTWVERNKILIDGSKSLMNRQEAALQEVKQRMQDALNRPENTGLFLTDMARDYLEESERYEVILLKVLDSYEKLFLSVIDRGEEVDTLHVQLATSRLEIDNLKKELEIVKNRPMDNYLASQENDKDAGSEQDADDGPGSFEEDYDEYEFDRKTLTLKEWREKYPSLCKMRFKKQLCMKCGEKVYKGAKICRTCFAGGKPPRLYKTKADKLKETLDGAMTEAEKQLAVSELEATRARLASDERKRRNEERYAGLEQDPEIGVFAFEGNEEDYEFDQKTLTRKQWMEKYPDLSQKRLLNHLCIKCGRKAHQQATLCRSCFAGGNPRHYATKGDTMAATAKQLSNDVSSADSDKDTSTTPSVELPAISEEAEET